MTAHQRTAGVHRTAWLMVLAALCAAPAPGAIVPLPPAKPAPTAASAGQPGEKKLSADEKREAAALPLQFRKKKGDNEARKALVDRAIELGGTAVPGLLAAVNAELAPLQPQYRQAFFKEAQQRVRTQLKDTQPADIESLRQTIVGTVKRQDLTKEMVVEKADPALKQLQEKLLVRREAVLEGADALKKMRDDLTTLEDYAQRLADALPAPAGKAPDAAASPPAKSAETLQAVEDLITLMVVAPDDRTRQVLLDNQPLEAKIQPEEARGLRHLNQIRLLAGLAPCRIDTRLCDAGRDHSKDMVEKKFFAHESPVPGKRQPWDRAKNFGTSANAENIANGQARGPDTIMQWWHSPGHLKNMMDSHSRVGLGCFQKTWTMMLGG